MNRWLQSSELPRYRELGGANGKGYPEVKLALAGENPKSVVRVNDQGELIVSVAVPIQRFRVLRGALLLSTQGGDIDAIVQAERLGILRVFLVAAGVTIVLSLLLAGTIAAPLRRLAAAAENVRRGVRSRPEIPDYSHRRDEIGAFEPGDPRHDHGALQPHGGDRKLCRRRLARAEEPADLAAGARSRPCRWPRPMRPRPRLTGIIQHDIRRLNRLISDISDASRLDAELARQDSVPVDIRQLLSTVVSVARDTTPRRRAEDPAATSRPAMPAPTSSSAMTAGSAR